MSEGWVEKNEERTGIRERRKFWPGYYAAADFTLANSTSPLFFPLSWHIRGLRIPRFL